MTKKTRRPAARSATSAGDGVDRLDMSPERFRALGDAFLELAAQWRLVRR